MYRIEDEWGEIEEWVEDAGQDRAVALAQKMANSSGRRMHVTAYARGDRRNAESVFWHDGPRHRLATSITLDPEPSTSEEKPNDQKD